jgi:hypothetical protein
MRPVLRVVAHEFSARWRSWVVLVFLVAVAGGAVLTAAAGARRTDSAYPRFLRVSKAADVLVSPVNTGLDGYYQALGRLPDVAAVAPVVGVNALPLGPGGRPEAGPVDSPLDGRLGRLLEIPKLLSGRLPLPGRPAEVAVDQIAAQDLHLHVGSRLELGAIAGSDPRQIRRLAERVVGVMVDRGSVVPVTTVDRVPFIVASTALLRQLGPGYHAFDGAYVKLRPGATVAGFSRQAQALARAPASGNVGSVYIADEAVQAATIERSIHPQAVALWLFALVLAVTALLIIGQAVARVLAAGSSDNATLSALGMTRRQLLAAGLTEVGVAAAAGALLAAGTAIAASPLMPIGPARLAEPDPGVSADVTVLVTGFAGIVLLLVARAGWPAWRLASAGYPAGSFAADAPGRPSLVARWLAGAGAPVTAATGVRLALEPGRGRSAIPVRSALTGTVLSVMAVTAAFTFGANLLHFVHTPRLYGQDWDTALDVQFDSIPQQALQHTWDRVPGVAGWTFGNHGTVQIGGHLVPAIGVTAGKGRLLSPTLLDGRPPRTAHEIVLGATILRQISRHVGQSVAITVAGHRQMDRIVGQAVFPDFGLGGFTPTDLGQGAEVTAAALEPAGAPAGEPGYNFVLLRFTPGPGRAADIAVFQRSVSAFCATIQQLTCLVTDQRPNGVTGYARIDGTPEVLAGVLAVLGLAVLGQFTVLSGRRRRRDFAVLKALGLLRRQVSEITAWQVTTLAALALLAGLPLGVAAGHGAWGLFAGSLGLPPGAITPMFPLLVIVPVLIIAANAIAYGTGRATARLSPARILHAE